MNTNYRNQNVGCPSMRAPLLDQTPRAAVRVTPTDSSCTRCYRRLKPLHGRELTVAEYNIATVTKRRYILLTVVFCIIVVSCGLNQTLNPGEPNPKDGYDCDPHPDRNRGGGMAAIIEAMSLLGSVVILGHIFTNGGFIKK